jgi:DNA-binding MarR family transcriptional regulator
MDQSPETQSFDYLLGQICKLHYSRLHTRLEELGLYRGQPPMLFALWHQEGLTHSELAEQLHVQPATITKMLERMERAGFLERRDDLQDRRVSRVYLTERAETIRANMHQIFHTMEDACLAGFDDQERAHLRVFLTRLRDNLIGMGEEDTCQDGHAPHEHPELVEGQPKLVEGHPEPVEGAS